MWLGYMTSILFKYTNAGATLKVVKGFKYSSS